MTKAHVFPFRIYYEDTDSGGIVYYANYLRYAERGRSELFRTLGIESSRLMDEDGVALAVRQCAVDFLKPARLDDALEVHTRITKVGGASVGGEQIIRRGGEDLVSMRIKLACLGMKDGKPARLPERLRAALDTYCGKKE